MVKASTGCAARSILVTMGSRTSPGRSPRTPCHGRAHIVQRLLRGLFQAEFGGRHRGAAVLDLGVDVLEALQRGNAVLDLARHVVFELRWRGAGQRHGDRDGGQVDVGEVLHLHGVEGQQAAKAQHTNSISAGMGFLIDQVDTFMVNAPYLIAGCA